MKSEWVAWGATERNFLTVELSYFKGGSKLLSPSGDDITASKIAQLEARIDHVSKLLEASKDA